MWDDTFYFKENVKDDRSLKIQYSRQVHSRVLYGASCCSVCCDQYLSMSVLLLTLFGHYLMIYDFWSCFGIVFNVFRNSYREGLSIQSTWMLPMIVFYVDHSLFVLLSYFVWSLHFLSDLWITASDYLYGTVKLFWSVITPFNYGLPMLILFVLDKKIINKNCLKLYIVVVIKIDPVSSKSTFYMINYHGRHILLRHVKFFISFMSPTKKKGVIVKYGDYLSYDNYYILKPWYWNFRRVSTKVLTSLCILQDIVLHIEQSRVIN